MMVAAVGRVPVLCALMVVDTRCNKSAKGVSQHKPATTEKEQSGNRMYGGVSIMV